MCMPIKFGQYIGLGQSSDEREFQQLSRLPLSGFSLQNNDCAQRVCKVIDRLEKIRDNTSNVDLRVKVEKHISHIKSILSPMLNGPDFLGGAPVHGAAYAGDYKTLHKLIVLGADLRVEEPLLGGSVLHIAIESGNLQCVQEIMKHAPELADRPNRNGLTPIAWAQAKNRPDISKAMIGRFDPIA